MDPDFVYHTPMGDFKDQVYAFDPWQTIWDQEVYERRINTEAEIMIALEAIRASIYDVDYDIDDLEACIEANSYAIHDNMDEIEENHAWI